ncbi:DUF1801 domain-containing protein [Galbibacter sp. PAP.153]|uniref:iron chaperone n=1 Tax=Galbibacter sp. PAP.153 TaxID=3104623 RepID=UPI00300B6A29
MSVSKPKDVDAYIAHADKDGHAIMETLQETIKTTVPEAEEVISWNVPIYKYYGILAGFNIFKQHVTFGIDTLTEEDHKILKEKGYKTGKKTIQIKFNQKVPTTIIKKLLKSQAEINKQSKK